MGRLSPEQQSQLEALERQRDAPDDDDDSDYAWVRLENGQSVRLHGARLRAYMKRNGLDAEDVEDTSRSDPAEPEDGAQSAPAAKKTAPAKKVPGKAAIKSGAVTDDAADPNADVDAPPAGSQRGGRGMGFF